MDYSGAARAPFSVHRWHEVGPADRGNDAADTDAGLVPTFHRRLRGARCPRPDSPLAAAYSTGLDTAGRRRANDHYDRCGRSHVGERRGRIGADPVSGWDAGNLRRLRPLATDASLDQILIRLSAIRERGDRRDSSMSTLDTPAVTNRYTVVAKRIRHHLSLAVFKPPARNNLV